MDITNEQLIELIDFSPSLDFAAKLRWRSYVSYLEGDDRELFFRFLSDEKKAITEAFQKKASGFNGYFFAKNLEDLEHEFMKKS